MRGTIFPPCVAVALALCLGAGSSGAAKKNARVSVAAGPVDRRESVVTFELPRELKGESYALQDEGGLRLPLQVGAGRRATFVLPELKAGAEKSYRLVEVKPGAADAAEMVGLTRGPKQLTIRVAGRPVLSFRERPVAPPPAGVKPVFLRGGYIHPVYTPSGRVVTDDYPSDHYHHHGIWFAWTKTEFEGRHPDFWNVGDGTGKVEFEGVDETWSGPVHAGFKSRQRYVDLSGTAPLTALNEVWEVTVYGAGRGAHTYFMFDLTATQGCATSRPLLLQQYRYGGMGVRGHRDWKDKGKVSFLTSEGKGRGNGDATRARWCHIGGPVDGRAAGIAVLDHPGNFRAPQPVRINPDDPFFNYAPSQLGAFEIEPGRPYVARYRYIVSDGPPDAAELERLWSDYAHPPRATVILK